MPSWFVAASLSGIACALLAIVVVAAGWRRQLAEVAILGTGLFSISVLATTFALSGTSYGIAPAEWAAALALPVGVLAVTPLLAPSWPPSQTIARHWRPWVIGWASAVLTLATVLYLGAATAPATARIVASVVGLVGAGRLASRQVLLYRVSGRRAALVTAGAVATVAVSSAWGLATSPGSAGAWAILVAENVGILGAGVAVIVGYTTGRGVSDVLAPLLSREPLAALDVGLSPEVHAFVAALAKKDQITRDHVVRTSALAMRTAIRSGLPPRLVREIALGALLHDIGKLVIPSDIIDKPGKLTDEEFRTIKTHPEQGERLLRDAPTLAPAARYVRAHHERVDGRGYPDGLAGDEISFEVGLVSVADAWDAMTHTRQYRQGMDLGAAETILREGAETQWRLDAVECLLAEVNAAGQAAIGDLTRLGEGAANLDVDHPLADCLCGGADGRPSSAVVEPSTAVVGVPLAPASPSSSRLLDRGAFASSVAVALETLGTAGQLISVRVVGLRPLTEGDGTEGDGTGADRATAGALMVQTAEHLVFAATRSDDVIGRWEPDHLVISLPSASAPAAAEIVRRIQVAAEELTHMAPMLRRLRLDVTAVTIRHPEVGLLGALLDGPDPVHTEPPARPARTSF